MMVAVYLVSTSRNLEPARQRASAREISTAGIRALPAFVLILLILGLLRFGEVAPLV
jgi:TRAP-type C4-dicarboxylate transport system permease large subunit